MTQQVESKKVWIKWIAVSVGSFIIGFGTAKTLSNSPPSRDPASNHTATSEKANSNGAPQDFGGLKNTNPLNNPLFSEPKKDVSKTNGSDAARVNDADEVDPAKFLTQQQAQIQMMRPIIKEAKPVLDSIRSAGKGAIDWNSLPQDENGLTPLTDTTFEEVVKNEAVKTAWKTLVAQRELASKENSIAPESVEVKK